METQCDMFAKVGDRRDIVDFVKEVEKYRCLYDNTLPEYANKVHNRRAWSAIAKRASTSVPDCRDKWRKIRISFMRSLKQQASDKPPMRPYYLTDHLHFLRPFIQIRPKTQIENQEPQAKPQRIEFEVATITKQEITDSDGSDYFENETNESYRPTYNNYANSHISKRSIENGNHKSRNNYTDDIEGNPRKMFLLSMLPDIETLSEPEMRIFRREVINLVDTIIKKRDCI